jgi:hypothetical protein
VKSTVSEVKVFRMAGMDNVLENVAENICLF